MQTLSKPILLFFVLLHISSYGWAGASDICYYDNQKYRFASSHSCSRDVNTSLFACCGLEKSVAVEKSDNEAACRNFIQVLQLHCSLSDNEVEDLNNIANGKLVVTKESPKVAKKDVHDLIAERVCYAMNTEIKSIQEGKSLAGNTQNPKANLLVGVDAYRVAQACSYTLYSCAINDKGQAAALEDQPWHPGPTPDLLSGPAQRFKDQWCYQAVRDKGMVQDSTNNDHCLKRISASLRAFGAKKNSSDRANIDNFAFQACRPRDSKNIPLQNIFTDIWNNGVDALSSGNKEH